MDQSTDPYVWKILYTCLHFWLIYSWSYWHSLNTFCWALHWMLCSRKGGLEDSTVIFLDKVPDAWGLLHLMWAHHPPRLGCPRALSLAGCLALFIIFTQDFRSFPRYITYAPIFGPPNRSFLCLNPSSQRTPLTFQDVVCVGSSGKSFLIPGQVSSQVVAVPHRPDCDHHELTVHAAVS